MSATPARGLIALLRLPYWMMTGGLALLTSFAITKGSLSLEIALLTFFSMASITSAGFSLNDYFDRESDAVIKPKRPIPSGALSLKQVVAISVLLFVVGLSLAALINKLSFIILLIDSILLVVYSAFIKRKSGFAANILIGILTGTAFIYGEAVTLGLSIISPTSLTLASLSLYPIACGTIGGNIVRDILSLEGDSKVGYPTLPQKIGNNNAVRIAAVFFIATGVLAPLPYLLSQFTIFYLPLIVVWSILLIYSSIRLVTSAPTLQNVRKYERLITMSMILLPLSLIIETLSPIIGGIL
ncbi:MAG: UbiA family prenyltransferase [Candidatus Bathyarchaeota archaeon]|nr:MAG: UbiA family prenyltransferase [Candidatus Bathyarchaeota archaeon]